MDTLTQQPVQDLRKLEDPRDVSGLKFFSMALVVKTPKEFPSWIIEVTPIESLAIQESGDIKKKDIPYKQTHQDKDGSYDSQKDVTMNNIIEAEWLPLSDSNRPTPPCVYRDETVVLYKFMDVQKYYWTTIKHEPDLRRKEMVRWAASNETEPLVPYKKETSYFLEFNAIDRFLEISTPVKGESVAYRIKIDVAGEQLDIADDRGNNIVLKSDEGAIDITAVNRITLNTKYIELNANETVVNSPMIHLNGETRVYRDLKVKQNTMIKKRLDVQVGYARTWFGSVSKGGPSLTDLEISERNRDVFVFDSEGSSPGSLAPPDANNPTPGTSKAYEMDRRETANKSPGELTGDKVMDAPKIASGKVPVVSKPDIPNLSKIQESAAKSKTPGHQLSESGGDDSGMNAMSAMCSRKVYEAEQEEGDEYVSEYDFPEDYEGDMDFTPTVIDPVNSVTRTAYGVSYVDQNPLSGVNSAVNGFLKPVNDLNQSIVSTSRNTLNQVREVQQAVYRQVGTPLSQATLASKTLSKVAAVPQSLSQTTTSLMNKANYAAMNVTQPLRTITDTVATTQRAVQNTQRQLTSLANSTTQGINAVRSSPLLKKLI